MRGRRENERATVRHMIELYCRSKGHAAATHTDIHCKEHASLCADCRELLDYAERRLEVCRHGDSKPACKKCPTHCYRPDYRARIRAVMRHSGPRLILHHPVEAVRHLLRTIF